VKGAPASYAEVDGCGDDSFFGYVESAARRLLLSLMYRFGRMSIILQPYQGNEIDITLTQS
jgi:hypothetical protein